MASKKTRTSTLVLVERNGEIGDRRPAVPARERRLLFRRKMELRSRAGSAAVIFRSVNAIPFSSTESSWRRGRENISIRSIPATEEKLAEIAEANAADVDLAVKAARRAHRTVWGKMPGRERGKYLYRIARLIQEKSRELAVLESMDGGKTIKESRDIDLPLVAAHFFYYAGWADKLEYAFPGRSPRPLGVAGQIIPWNFPLLMAAWKLAPALACGNTCVLKPAETTSITALHLAEILQDAELPDGVVNIVTGAGETGKAIVDHPDIQKLAFTGSTEVGKRILKSIAGTGKKLTLELGRKSGQHHLRRRSHRSGGRRHHLRNLFQSGPRLLRRLATVRAGRSVCPR